jgi:transcriptional regulator with XRE-family HTH domain
MREAMDRKDFGAYLRNARNAAGLTLREVEGKTKRVVRNGYLSQIETGGITRPSPRILYELAQVYGISYRELLIRAGHRVPDEDVAAEHRVIPDLPLSAFEGLDAEDRAALIEYAAFLRQRKSGR